MLANYCGLLLFVVARVLRRRAEHSPDLRPGDKFSYSTLHGAFGFFRFWFCRFFLRLLSGDMFCGRWNRSWLGIVSFLFGGKSLERQFAGCGFSNKSLAQDKVFQFRFERGRKVA